MKLTDLVARAKVIAKDAVTWLTIGAGAATMAAPHVAEYLPNPPADDVSAWLLRGASWALVAVTIIRRTVPADKKDRTVLGGRQPGVG